MSKLHNIINCIDLVKEKLTDLEYKNIIDEIEKEYYKENKFYQIEYIEYLIETQDNIIETANTEITENTSSFPIQSLCNIGEEKKMKYIKLRDTEDDLEFQDYFLRNEINSEMLTQFKKNKYLHFMCDNTTYCIQIVFIFKINEL